MGSETILLSLSLGLWTCGFIVFQRISTRRPSAISGGLPLSLSIIIPARNEAHNLPALLQSINAQSVRPQEVIVVDDASSDRTAEVARSHGAAVISSKPLPNGWRGKTWACQQGAEAAKSETLLFLDADTWLETEGLSRILGLFGDGALSVGPYHAVRQPYEHLSAFFNLIMAAATVPDGLFGQMLLVSRNHYLLSGGHQAVRGRILENFHLASRFRAEGIPLFSLIGRGLLTFRMYPNGLGELIAGWVKGFASGAGQTPLPRLLLIIAWLTGMTIPLSFLPSSSLAQGLYILFAAQIWLLFRQVGSFRWYAAALYPVPLFFFFAIFARAVLGAGNLVTWKGRTIHAD